MERVRGDRPAPAAVMSKAPALAPKLRAAGSARKSSVILRMAERRPSDPLGGRDGGGDLMALIGKLQKWIGFACSSELQNDLSAARYNQW